MNYSVRTAFAVGICLVMGSGIAHAQAVRTWVSGVGDDANPCSRTAPCKTFAGAINNTAAGGEISVLDPGGFGAVTITDSVTIDGDGTLASILASSGNGIVVNGPDAVLTLRNISLICTNGLALKGVHLLNGAAIILDHVTISGFETAVASTTGNVLVINSTLVRNRGFAVHALGGTITVENSTLTNNGVAVQADAGATVNLSNNGVYNNQTGFGCGGTLATANNNRKGNNTGGTAPVCGTNAVISLK
jgi:hypothetical protein